jgi:murein DD-endopeptidase MepM/ murein hydrolase activator NlpD
MIELPIFDLPFDFKTVNILQGFHGPWSHKEISRTQDLTFAVDFILPVGTPVLAVESGIVFGVYDWSDFSYEGTDPKIGNSLKFGKTNFIILKHENDLFTIYSHLEMGSAMVSRGEKISPGHQIARTGRSGWIGPNPHLHFQLVGHDHIHTLPFNLKEYPHPLEHSDIFSS